jgi:nicotinamide-nucleotide amidase
MRESTDLLLFYEQLRQHLCRLLADLMLKKHFYLSTAESCTGGLIASACTDLSGSSQWFDRGFVTYSNAAKTEMLGVDAALIEQFGAVSEQVVSAMALGAVQHSNAQVSVAVTGIAGPTGGSVEKPVGTVWIGWCIDGKVSTQLSYFKHHDRNGVRFATMQQALQGLIVRLEAL